MEGEIYDLNFLVVAMGIRTQVFYFPPEDSNYLTFC